jgi:hypothetical protein
LRWEHVDWAGGKLMVRSSKTEGQGKAVRFVPLFPELRAVLMAAFEAAEPGTEWVIARYREPSCNLRTQFTRIIERAGLVPWPRLFHNLRSSRQTELAALFPIHVVCAWLGNSAAVAQAHYLQVRDSDFQAAAGATTSDAKRDAAGSRTGPQGGFADDPGSRESRGLAGGCGAVQRYTSR